LINRQRAFVTGASSGIGLDIARELAAKNFDLILTARSREALDRIAAELSSAHGIDARVFAHDLARADSPRELFDAITAAGLVVDILINNAGFATYGPFVDGDIRTYLDLLQVNVVALTHLTKLFLPGMLQRRSGRILNVASTAAFLPGPLMAVYYASKAYVLHFSEALAEEVRGNGVTVTALCPSATRTGFQRRGGLDHSNLFRGHVLESATVARQGVDAMLRGQTLVIPGLRNQLLIALARFSPRWLIPRVVRRMQAPVVNKR
jgi:short-subunit dehydrogenase